MIRAQVQLEESQYRALKESAARQQMSMAELIRRAVKEWLETSIGISDQERRQRAMAVVGQFRSGLSDIAERHDEYLAEAYGE